MTNVVALVIGAFLVAVCLPAVVMLWVIMFDELKNLKERK